MSHLQSQFLIPLQIILFQKLQESEDDMDSSVISSRINEWQSEQWHQNLDEKAKYLFFLINAYHGYFSSKDKKYKKIVQSFRVFLLFLTMLSTIVLGLKTVINIDAQIVIGLILSSIITFLTAVLSYFNIEEYWTRNVKTHIALNMLRDNFIFDSKAGALDAVRSSYYRDQLDSIQRDNIRYWEEATKRI